MFIGRKLQNLLTSTLPGDRELTQKEVVAALFRAAKDSSGGQAAAQPPQGGELATMWWLVCPSCGHANGFQSPRGGGHPCDKCGDWVE